MIIKNMIIRCPYENGFIDDESVLKWKKVVEKREEEDIVQGQSTTAITYICHCNVKYLGTKSRESFEIQFYPWHDGMGLTNLKIGQNPHLCKASMHNPNKKDYEYLKEKLKPRKEFNDDV
jgi:hypothetical protein